MRVIVLRLRVRVERVSDPDVGSRTGHTRSRGENADDLDRPRAERDAFADDIRIGTESATPVSVRQQSDARIAVRIELVSGGEESSELRADAEHRERARADVDLGHTLRRMVAVAGDDHDGIVIERDVGERPAAILEVEVLSSGDAVLFARFALRPERADVNESIGIRIWQRTKHDAIEQREDRRRGAESERQRDDGDE